MINEKTISYLENGPFLCSGTTVTDLYGFVFAVCEFKEEAESLTIILNDGWSRLPKKEGERCCGTCRYMKVLNEEESLEDDPWLVCSLPAPAVCFGDRRAIRNPKEFGTNCAFWQRNLGYK